jgi:GMP synthase (glutamine-hydrolysing)
MRLGLLLCDHVRGEFQSLGGDYPDYFTRFFGGPDLITYDLTAGNFPEDLSACDAWVGSGSLHGVYEDVEWIKRFAALVRRLDHEERRYVGVCFGAQMIAHALGGRVAPAPHGWQVGIKEARVGPGRRLRILHCNQDQILEMAPRMRLLATADTNPNEVVAVGEHFLGLQGHPEFTVAYVEALIKLRQGTLIPDEVAEAGLRSLALAPDAEDFREMIIEFLVGGVSAITAGVARAEAGSSSGGSDRY